MRKPNFFIIGAPKCGTTSMANWLSSHPSVYMPSVKEPHYFNTDDKRYINTLAGYESLFANVGPGHEAIGEASVWYFYSAAAVPNILAYQPQARFIVMLRNPIEMAPSLHEEMVFSGLETETAFEAAWELQGERLRGRHTPRFGDVRRLLYGEACKLGAQMQRLLATAPADRVLAIILDDVRRDPLREYGRVLNFLDLRDDGRTEFPVLNTAKKRRWPLVPRLANAVVAAKRQLGIERGFGLFQSIEKANVLPHTREHVSAAMTARLRAYFADDIALLQDLLARNLSAWRAQV